MHQPLANGVYCALFDFFSFRVGHGTEAIILVILADWLLFLHGLTFRKSNKNSLQKGHGGLKETGTSTSVGKMGLCTLIAHRGATLPNGLLPESM